MTEEDELTIRSSLEDIKSQKWHLIEPFDWFATSTDRLQPVSLSASLYNVSKSRIQSGLTFYGRAYELAIYQFRSALQS